jgi:hypothetical protein
MGANPEGLDREGRRDLYFFIHNVYANFFKDALDYFSLHLYPRFEYKVVGTYDKALEYLTKECQYGRETDMQNRPALILNPTGDFDLADANAGGKQLWRFPNLAPGMVKRIFDPVYKDEQVQIDVGFIRIQGDLELMMLVNSFYEYCDLKMLFLQIFAGFERWIYPQFFTTFIILPEELVNYHYSNPYTGLSYNLDWSTAGAYDKLVKTIAQDKLVLPCSIKPTYKLTSFNDASERFGGVDGLPDWKLGATVHYEIEIPSFLVLQTDYLAKHVDINITAGSVYSAYTDYTIPEFKATRRATYLWGIDSTTHTEIYNADSDDATCINTYVGEYDFRERYYHIIEQAEVDSTSNLIIELPAAVDDINELLLNSKYGVMNYGDHYTLINSNQTVEINRDNVDLEVGMIIELYTYKRKD